MITHTNTASLSLQHTHVHAHTHTLEWVGSRMNAWQMPDTLVSVQSL